MLQRLLSVITSLTLVGCASPQPFGPTALAPGMSRQQVVDKMGPPSGFASGKGGLECLTFDVRQTPLAVSPMTMKHEVVLKDGVVVSSATKSPLESWGANSAAGAIAVKSPCSA